MLKRKSPASALSWFLMLGARRFASTRSLYRQMGSSSTQAKIDAIPTSETLSPASQALVGRLNKYLKLKSDYESRLKILIPLFLRQRFRYPYSI